MQFAGAQKTRRTIVASFTHNALIRWYRNGIDVQTKLTHPGHQIWQFSLHIDSIAVPTDERIMSETRDNRPSCFLSPGKLHLRICEYRYPDVANTIHTRPEYNQTSPLYLHLFRRKTQRTVQRCIWI